MMKSIWNDNNNSYMHITINFGYIVSRLLTIKKKKEKFTLDFELIIFDKYGLNEFNMPYSHKVDFDVIKNLHIKKFVFPLEELKSLIDNYIVYVLEKTTIEQLINMTGRYYVTKEDIEMPPIIKIDICINNKKYSVKGIEFIKVICDVIQNNFTFVDSKYEDLK